MAAPNVVRHEVCLVCGRESLKMICNVCALRLEEEARHTHNAKEHPNQHSQL
jgi:predicted amidophosphoribosyltransferase